MAFDIGSSSGRGMLGCFDGERITLEEIHRFGNGPIQMMGMVYWDALNIFQNMIRTFEKYKQVGVGRLACFGIDAWGNDYGLLDKNHQLISNLRCSRHTTQADVEAVHAIVPGLDIYHHTGLSSYSINTLYQVCRRIREGDPGIENAYALMMVPDLLAFFCTGELQSEFTISTTSMMYDPIAKDWAWDLIDKLQIPRRIFQKIKQPGALGGKLTKEVAGQAGVDRVPYALVGSHDTASAVVACPVADDAQNWAFCSAGTWCLMGIETQKAAIADEYYENNISNEGTVQGGFRPIKNMVGLWILQECMKKWKAEGLNLDYDQLALLVKEEKPFRSLIDVDHKAFFEVGDMPMRIQQYCADTKQSVPETPGQIARCVYESLALKYRWCLEWFDRIRGRRIERIYITGGGSRSSILNQMTADSTGRMVTAGPVEAACMGNLLTQAMALGEIHGIGELRQVVRNSSRVEQYEPRGNGSLWDEAYNRFQRLLAGKHENA